MKKVFNSHSELAHVWAQNNQLEGRASRMFFENGRLYSYGKHFCIARILESGVVVFGTHTYSSSTGTHQSRASRAVSHRKMVFCYDPDASAHNNKDRTERSIKAKLAHAEAKGVREKTRIQKRVDALREAEQFNEYLAALPKKERNCKPICLKSLEVSAENRARLVQLKSEAQAKREARWEKDAEKRKVILAKAQMALAEKIVEWRANVYNHLLYNAPTMLRLSKDGQSVETSKGAEIPVSHAKRLWPLIENVRAVGKPLTDRDFHLGHYTLTEIKADGSIIVGCHNIAYSEIEGIAKALGLLENAAAA